MLRFFVTQSDQSLTKLLQWQTKRASFKVALICIVAALVLTLHRYLGDYRFVLSVLKSIELNNLSNIFQSFMLHHVNAQLHQLMFWASSIVLFYFILPLLVIVLVIKEKPGDYGLAPNYSFSNYRPYLIMIISMIPLIAYFSGTDGFLASYPFYKVGKNEGLYPNFVIWEIFYFLQFIALEFLFRGFLLHGTKRRFGVYSIFVMTIPYCMIHFGKPLPETIGAIVAGIVLGAMSLKSKSIWPGVMLHYGIAIMMDLSVLYRKGIL
ncbi:CPBP family intramembrane glutamic endopeptidase [Nitrosomonas sp. Is37]|uniref:CPBP family intramembrane glutamic endopeptidase n=1 Tax=Nitrosomonas sp. Is37 TaxID=3080535 RepID=UPI00294B07FB|nr:CPBP family intramembrane glutamic endopeptidase [Nitrosomonas sp. Is37]MDV6344685.1 CPBP family intramembrane glutamic endopeptidase [Nitrosomonas sp. Is37]